jgi:hypothetical protein
MEKYSAIAAVIVSSMLLAGVVCAQTPITPGSPEAAGHGLRAAGPAGQRPAVNGTVDSVSGSIIAVTGRDKNTYSVDASNAKITKGFGANSQTLAITDIKQGDTVAVAGTVNGANVAATAIMDGAGGARAGVAGAVQNNAGGKMQNRSGQEIDTRLASLDALAKRIGQMQKLSDSEKTSLQSDVQSVIDQLTALKAKIAADTDTATIKTDTQSITKAYRVYMLVLPKVQILAAVDRINTIAANLTTVAGKLQAELGPVPSNNVAAITAALTDLSAKVADAKSQAAAASAEVAGLVPDNGEQVVAASNAKMLKDARTKIQVAQKDLVEAQKDAKTAVLGIKKLSKTGTVPGTTATTTVSN